MKAATTLAKRLVWVVAVGLCRCISALVLSALLVRVLVVSVRVRVRVLSVSVLSVRGVIIVKLEVVEAEVVGILVALGGVSLAVDIRAGGATEPLARIFFAPGVDQCVGVRV